MRDARHAIGIDLGTTNTVVARVNAEGMPVVICDEALDFLIPSMVYLGDGQARAGTKAKEKQDQGISVEKFFKRSMGDPLYIRSYGERDYTATDLSALLLREAKAHAERALGSRVTEVVVTVPAYFGHTQRNATMEAAEQAGLRVIKLLNEPTAAALAYGLLPQPERQLVLVYDLGGGTFDVSLIETTASELRVLVPGGDHFLGGKDWDDCLIEYLVNQFQQAHKIELTHEEIERFRPTAEHTKHVLSRKPHFKTTLQIRGYTEEYTITRALFESLTRDLVERTHMLTERVLRDSGYSWSQIDGVLLVGGSTFMPMVRASIERVSGKPPLTSVNPNEAVALGAALQAAMELQQRGGQFFPGVGSKTLVDATAHSLGMIAESPDRASYVNSILIQKNQSVPAKQTRSYSMRMRRDGEMRLEIFLTQGESIHPYECDYLGRYVFSGFPIIKGKKVQLEITYEYDGNSIGQIVAIEKSTGQQLQRVIEPLPLDVAERFNGRPIDQHRREPLTIYLALDLSGSMHGEPLDKTRQALRDFVRACDLSNTAIGLISFSNTVHINLEANQNSRAILRAIDQLEIWRTGYGNNAHPFDALYKSLHQRSGLRYAVILTDGVWSYEGRALERARLCHEAGVEVVAVDIGSANTEFLAQIDSSGEPIQLTTLNQLSGAFSTIAQEIAEQSDAQGALTPDEQ